MEYKQKQAAILTLISVPHWVTPKWYTTKDKAPIALQLGPVSFIKYMVSRLMLGTVASLATTKIISAAAVQWRVTEDDKSQSRFQPDTFQTQTIVQTGGCVVALTHFSKVALSTIVAAVNILTACFRDVWRTAKDSLAVSHFTGAIFIIVGNDLGLSTALLVVWLLILGWIVWCWSLNLRVIFGNNWLGISQTA